MVGREFYYLVSRGFLVIENDVIVFEFINKRFFRRADNYNGALTYEDLVVCGFILFKQYLLNACFSILILNCRKERMMKYLFFMLMLVSVQAGIAQASIAHNLGLDAKDSLDGNIISLGLEDEKEVFSNIAIDSNSFKSHSNALKNEFRDELEKSLDNLVLTDLDKDDLSERVDNLQASYRQNERYRQITDYDPNFDSELNSYGKREVAEDWLDNELSSASIFEEYPAEVYADKQSLKQNLGDLKKLSEEKASLLENGTMDKSIQNNYHKYLKGQKEADDLERSIKSSKTYKTKSQRKSSEKLLKEIKRLESREQRIKEEIKENKYIKYLQGEREDYLEGFEEAGEFDEELLYSKLNERVKNDELQSLLSNDYISSHIDEQHTDLEKVKADVIEKEVLQVLDPLGKDWKDDAAEIKKHIKRTDEKEVKEWVAKDPHEKRLLPENTFFEGIVSFSKGDFSMFSLSPNVRYEFRHGPSIGLGLTLHHTRDASAYIRTALDYKMFAKYMVLKGLFFVQAEYIALVPGISYIEAEEGAAKLKRTGVLTGGGFNLKIKRKNILSLGIMYNLNQDMGVPTYDSPILVRLGIKPF